YIRATGAGKHSRSASREAEGTGPKKPRQPASRRNVQSPAEQQAREDVSSERKESAVPAVSLRCRVCESEYACDAVGVCARCFGPLDPIYDWDVLGADATRARVVAGPAP